ncbi:MAG: SMP-30/gluconolactonase/LRE family protein [Dehalococcoidia bacterium]|nr:SMP-30/gluconolactonase/LRE family protein [Dehalococcoidia bacterium]
MTTDTTREGFEIYDERFRAMVPDDAMIVRHHTGMDWAEGPVYFAEGDYLLWSDIPNDVILKYSDADGVSVFRSPCGYTNGHYRDAQGRLLSCEHGGRRVSRTEPDGTVVTLADNYEGKKLNSPNDLAVKSDGSIWFTDPPYGILSDRQGHKGESELGACYVFRLEPDTGTLEIVADDFDRPNGICFSPDESVLYVSDTGEPGHIRAFDVVDGRSLANSRVFAEVSPGKSDGFRSDTEGNIFTSARDGIHVYSPQAELLGKILTPENAVANCCFGGSEKNRLYIAADKSLYSVVLNAQGAQMP